MVDDHLCGIQRVHLVWVATQILDSLAHRGEVHHAGHTGEVLHENTCRGELDFRRGFCLRIPVSNSLDVVFGGVLAVFVAQQVLTKNLQRVREFFHPRDSGKRKVIVGLITNGQLRLCPK